MPAGYVLFFAVSSTILSYQVRKLPSNFQVLSLFFSLSLSVFLFLYFYLSLLLSLYLSLSLPIYLSICLPFLFVSSILSLLLLSLYLSIYQSSSHFLSCASVSAMVQQSLIASTHQEAKYICLAQFITLIGLIAFIPSYFVTGGRYFVTAARLKKDTAQRFKLANLARIIYQLALVRYYFSQKLMEFLSTAHYDLMKRDSFKNSIYYCECFSAL